MKELNKEDEGIDNNCKVEYSLKFFYIYGVQRSIISITTISYIVLYNVNKELFNNLIIVYIVWLILSSYDNFFDKLKQHNMPTAQWYKSKIPFFISAIL